MNRLDPRRSILLYALWLGFLGAVVVLGVADLLPFRLTFVRPDNLFVCLVEGELFFMLWIWPLFVPRLRGEPPGAGADLLFPWAFLLLLALPFALAAANVSSAGAGTLFRAHVLVAAWGAFAAALFASPAARSRSLGAWYFLALAVFSAAFPFLAFLGSELGGGALRFLAAASPFWAGARVGDAGALVQGGVAPPAAAALAARSARKSMDRPAPAG